ncbi:MAG: recombinase RecT [Thalassotalea sp.]|nr:recombinase RecT [Thalassotalea sp.]
MSNNTLPKICAILGVEKIEQARRLITNQLFQEKPPLAGHLETVIAVCEKYNLNPMLRELYVRFGEGQDIYPTLTVDGWYNLVNSHSECNGYEFFEMGEMIEVPQHPFEPSRHRPTAYPAIGCKIYRKGREHAPIIYEYLFEVFNPNNPVYYTHPNRLLRHRSFIQAARVVFSLSGIYDAEEVDQILNGKHGESLPNQTNFSSEPEQSEQAQEAEFEFEVIKPGEVTNQTNESESEPEIEQTQKEVGQQETAEPPKKEEAQPSVESNTESELDDATRQQLTLRLKSAASNGQLDECIKILSKKAPNYANDIKLIAKQFAA